MKYLITPKSRRLPRVCCKGVDSVYHVLSRINGRAFFFTDVEKEAFASLLKRVAGVLWGGGDHLCIA